MVNIMTAGSQEELEELLKEVLEEQKSLLSFIKSKSEDPVVVALALYTACCLILDDHEEGSDVVNRYIDMVPRLQAIVNLGHEAVLNSLHMGKYQDVFALSVEIGAQEYNQDDELDIDFVEDDDVDRSTLN